MKKENLEKKMQSNYESQLRAAIEKAAKNHQWALADIISSTVGAERRAYKAGAELLLPHLVRARARFEYIKEHELYHGVNQGRDSEDVAAEGIADLDKLLEG